MKKTLSITLAIVILVMTTVTAFAVDSKSIFDFLKVPAPRTIHYANTVAVSAHSSFTSYQYEVKTTYNTVNFAAGTTGNTFTAILYGANSVGGTKYEVGRMTGSGDSLIVDRNYKYYSFVIQNNSSVGIKVEVSLVSDM